MIILNTLETLGLLASILSEGIKRRGCVVLNYYQNCSTALTKRVMILVNISLSLCLFLSHSCIHTHSCTNTLTYTCTHTHIHTHTHTHTHKHTQTHTHFLHPSLPFSISSRHEAIQAGGYIYMRRPPPATLT